MSIQQTIYQAMRKHELPVTVFRDLRSDSRRPCDTARVHLQDRHAPETRLRTLVIWLNVHECTGCTESLIRSGQPLCPIVSQTVVTSSRQAMAAGGSGTATSLVILFRRVIIQCREWVDFQCRITVFIGQCGWQLPARLFDLCQSTPFLAAGCLAGANPYDKD